MMREVKHLDLLFVTSQGNARYVLGQPSFPLAITPLFERVLPQIYEESGQRDPLHNAMMKVDTILRHTIL